PSVSSPPHTDEAGDRLPTEEEHGGYVVTGGFHCSTLFRGPPSDHRGTPRRPRSWPDRTPSERRPRTRTHPGPPRAACGQSLAWTRYGSAPGRLTHGRKVRDDAGKPHPCGSWCLPSR